jgi:hypothetical protein
VAGGAGRSAGPDRGGDARSVGAALLKDWVFKSKSPKC